MQGAESGDGGIDRLLHLRFVCHIGDHEFRAAAETCREFFARVAIEIGEHYLGARARQLARGRRTQARSAARNQKYAVFYLA